MKVGPGGKKKATLVRARSAGLGGREDVQTVRGQKRKKTFEGGESRDVRTVGLENPRPLAGETIIGSSSSGAL